MNERQRYIEWKNDVVQAPGSLGNTTGERFHGTVHEYLRTIDAAVATLSPRADRRWIQERHTHSHLVLPYHEGPYDFVAINTPSTYEQGAIPTDEEPPIGMIRVTASAVAAGYRAGTLDAHALNLSIDEIRGQLKRTKPKLVGINPTSVNTAEGKTLALMCDELAIPYVLGGIHATLDPENARRDFPTALAVVRGDGEAAIRQILDATVGGKSRSEINGVFYPEADMENMLLYGYTPKIPIEAIPDHPQDQYVQFPLVLQNITVDGEKKTVTEGSLYCTRGCAFECGFCASPVMVGRGLKGVRPYDHPGMDRVVREVGDMIRIGATAIHFLDDMVIVRPQDVVQFHNTAEKEGILGEFVWRGMTRAPVVARDNFDETTMAKLKESGCWRMTMGVESGDNDVLSMIKKHITTQDVQKAVGKLASCGIGVKAFFIMGFPGETWAQMQRTRTFALQLKNSGLTTISLFQFKPYPGTALWDKVARENPEALKRLDYVGGDARTTVGGNRGNHGVWLPDDLVIADGVPSGRVRELVTKTLDDFFGQRS